MKCIDLQGGYIKKQRKIFHQKFFFDMNTGDLSDRPRMEKKDIFKLMVQKIKEKTPTK